jgi:GATA-binding protein
MDRMDEDDAMNLDDFIVPESVDSPSGVSASPSADKTDTSTIEPSSVHAVTSAIPIKNRKDQSSNHHTGSLQAEIIPASFPHPAQDRRRETEFGYVQRRVRKTSVDERNVRLLFPSWFMFDWYIC